MSYSKQNYLQKHGRNGKVKNLPLVDRKGKGK